MNYVFAFGAMLLFACGVVFFMRLDKRLKYGSYAEGLCKLCAWGFGIASTWAFFLVWDIVFFVLFLLFLAGVCYTLVESISYIWGKVFP